MDSFNIHRVLVDEGSSVNVIYNHLFRTLQHDDTQLSPFAGSDLQGFNGSTSKPWGYVDLFITFGEETSARQIKV